MAATNIDKVIQIQFSSIKEIYFKWYLFTRPIHKMSFTSIKVLVEMLSHVNYLLDKDVSLETLSRSLFSAETRKEICDACNITPNNFRQILHHLYKNGILDKKCIIPSKYLLNINDDVQQFKLLLYFNRIDGKDI